MADFVAIDFETANEKRDSACALGVALVVDGQIVESEKFLIRPYEMRFADFNVMLHGISESDVEDAPTLKELWPTVWEICKDRLFVAHNAAFDMSVLRHSFHANGMEFPRFDYLCSLNVSKVAWPNLLSHKLAFIASHHGIPLEHHCPKSDAEASAKILLKAGEEYSTCCPLELSESLDVGIGELYPDGQWVPSSSPYRGSRREALEFELPDGFDITRHPFFQKTLVITGKLGFCTKDEAKEVISVLGGTFKTSVSKKTHILVVGEQDLRVLAQGETESTKLRKAKQLMADGHGIELMTAQDFHNHVFCDLESV